MTAPPQELCFIYNHSCEWEGF